MLKPYLYQKADWPNFYWDQPTIMQRLGEVRNAQGRILGKMESLGVDLKNKAVLDTLTLDVIKSTEIEGEFLDPVQVRSSISRRLGLEIAGAVDSDRNVDGMVDMMLDATGNCFQSITSDRLFGWHSSLFPSGRSGMYTIEVGKWRTDATGPMQVVSGALGKEKVHFQAPDSVVVPFEMERFMDWFNSENQLDLVIKAAVAHLWFVTIHPFDDGNGRITRALTDLLLARSDKTHQRFYSMSAQIRVERKGYYEMLENTQQGSLNITDWILWFLNCLTEALRATEIVSEVVFQKTGFWNSHHTTILNDRQRVTINRLFDGFEGKLTTSKWAKMNKCSADTALRDIQDLMIKGIMNKEEAGGRSTSYVLTSR